MADNQLRCIDSQNFGNGPGKGYRLRFHDNVNDSNQQQEGDHGTWINHNNLNAIQAEAAIRYLVNHQDKTVPPSLKGLVKIARASAIAIPAPMIADHPGDHRPGPVDGMTGPLVENDTNDDDDENDDEVAEEIVSPRARALKKGAIWKQNDTCPPALPRPVKSKVAFTPTHSATPPTTSARHSILRPDPPVVVDPTDPGNFTIESSYYKPFNLSSPLETSRSTGATVHGSEVSYAVANEATFGRPQPQPQPTDATKWHRDSTTIAWSTRVTDDDKPTMPTPDPSPLQQRWVNFSTLPATSRSSAAGGGKLGASIGSETSSSSSTTAAFQPARQSPTTSTPAAQTWYRDGPMLMKTSVHPTPGFTCKDPTSATGSAQLRTPDSSAYLQRATPAGAERMGDDDNNSTKKNHNKIQNDLSERQNNDPLSSPSSHRSNAKGKGVGNNNKSASFWSHTPNNKKSCEREFVDVDDLDELERQYPRLCQPSHHKKASVQKERNSFWSNDE